MYVGAAQFQGGEAFRLPYRKCAGGSVPLRDKLIGFVKANQ